MYQAEIYMFTIYIFFLNISLFYLFDWSASLRDTTAQLVINKNIQIKHVYISFRDKFYLKLTFCISTPKSSM